MMPRPSLLLVEDDSALRSQLERLLTREGYAVTSAATIAEARAAFHAQRFDVCVLDPGLPDGNAELLIPELVQRFPRIAVIVFSGTYVTSEDAVRMLELGAIRHLRKPVSLSDLLHEVDVQVAWTARQSGSCSPPLRRAGTTLRSARGLPDFLPAFAVFDSAVVLFDPAASPLVREPRRLTLYVSAPGETASSVPAVSAIYARERRTGGVALWLSPDPLAEHGLARSDERLLEIARRLLCDCIVEPNTRPDSSDPLAPLADPPLVSGELRIESDRVRRLRLDDPSTLVESRLTAADLDLLRLLLSHLGELVSLEAITHLIGRGATRSAVYERVRSLRQALGETSDDRGLLIATKRGAGWGIGVAHLFAIAKEIGRS